MELLVIVIIAFLVGKAFGRKNKRRRDDWPDEPVTYAPPKEKGCLSRLFSNLVRGIAFFVVIVFVFSVFGSDDASQSSAPVDSAPVADVSSAPVNPTTAPTAVPTAEVTAVTTVAPTAEPTAAPNAELSTLQEWAEHIAQQVYGRFDYEYTDLISVECMQVDGENAPMIIINVKYPNSFMRDNDDRMGLFLYDVMRTMKKIDELADQKKIEYGSVFVHGRSMFMDDYGNEFEADAAQIRIKASEAEKVNWDNISGDMLPKIAVSFGMQPVIRDGLSPSYYNSIKK